MIGSLFGKSQAQEDRKRAKADYENACDETGDSRAARALKIRAGLRARAHVDKTFIDGAEKANAYNDACLVAIANGEERPPPPKATAYQRVPSVNGEVVAYVPLEFAEAVFKLGGRYQLMEVTAQQAIQQVQAVADRISLDLGLEQPFEALGFLREELAEAGESLEEAGATEETAESAAGAAGAKVAAAAPAARSPSSAGAAGVPPRPR